MTNYPEQNTPSPSSSHAGTLQPPRKRWYVAEDWWAVWIGAVLLAGCTAALYGSLPEPESAHSTATEAERQALNLTSET